MNTKTKKAINDITTKLQSLELDLKDILTDEASLYGFSATEHYKISKEVCKLLQSAINTLEQISN